MKDKITQESFESIIADHKNDIPALIAQEVFFLHQQSLQQILEEAGEGLPDDKKLLVEFPNSQSENEAKAMYNRRKGAKWMRSEASKVVAKLKEEIKDKIAGWERCAKALDATSEDLNRCRAEIQRLKEELGRK